MPIDDLSLAEIFVKENGYCIVSGLISDELIAAVIYAAVARADFLAGDYNSLMQPHREDSVHLEIMRHPDIVDVVEALIGPALGLQTQFFYGMPGAKGFLAHQDMVAVDCPADKFMSAWVPLVDVDCDNGTLVVWPGTHKLGVVSRVHTGEIPGGDKHSGEYETMPPHEFVPVYIKAAAGDVVFFHGALVHGSCANLTDRPRYAQLNTYIRQGTMFRQGATAHRVPIDLR